MLKNINMRPLPITNKKIFCNALLCWSIDFRTIDRSHKPQATVDWLACYIRTKSKVIWGNFWNIYQLQYIVLIILRCNYVIMALKKKYIWHL